MARILGIDRSKYEPGDILPIGASTPGTFTLLADGSAVSIAAYPRLYAKIGNTYGVSGDPTKFLLPDSRSRGWMGAGQGAGLTMRTLGQQVGTETQAVSAMPTHLHTGSTTTQGAHFHTTTRGPGGEVLIATNPGSHPPWYSNAAGAETNPSGAGVITPPQPTDTQWTAHTHTFSLGNDGSGTAHNNIQPTLVIGCCIVYW